MNKCATCKHYQLMGELPACKKKRKILLKNVAENLTCWEPYSDFIKFFNEIIGDAKK